MAGPPTSTATVETRILEGLTPVDARLQRFHNTRHASPWHMALKDRPAEAIRSPWLSRFDWVFDVGLDEGNREGAKPILNVLRREPASVFVKSGRLKDFEQQILPRLTQPVLLYVGNGDCSLAQNRVDIDQLLRHPMIHKIACENRDIDDDRIAAFPIGTNPVLLLQEDSFSRLDSLRRSVRLHEKQEVIVGTWKPDPTILRTRNDREDARTFMLSHPEICQLHDASSQQESWEKIAGARFMLAPWGNGYDTHEIFEALMLKTIPVVVDGPHAAAFKGLPVVVVRYLSDLTQDRLQQWWRQMQPGLRDQEYLESDFWWRKVRRLLPVRKRAYLVLGAESSGNHLVTDLLVEAGCMGNSGFGGDWQDQSSTQIADDTQPWDLRFPKDEDPIVWRRSVPHLRKYPDIASMVQRLRKRDYSVTGFVVVRDRHAVARSQVHRGHVESLEESVANIQSAYRHIFRHVEMADLDYEMVSYESLVQSAEARKLWLRSLNLNEEAAALSLFDGNQRWYEAEAEPELATSRKFPFPEHWFPCESSEQQARFHQQVQIGLSRIKELRVAICGLARDIERQLPRLRYRIEKLGECFADYRVVLVENDSEDETCALLSEWAAGDDRVHVSSERIGARRWGQVRDQGRTRAMAEYRNRYLDQVASNCAHFDVVVVLDTDSFAGFSLEGIAHSFAQSGWDCMTSNGLLVPPHGAPPAEHFFFDSFPFREPGQQGPGDADKINTLEFRRGQALVRLDSAFGGLAIYQMKGILSGARYSGEDCEHVCFHQALAEKGAGRLYLNPSQVYLYSRLDRS